MEDAETILCCWFVCFEQLRQMPYTVTWKRTKKRPRICIMPLQNMQVFAS